MTEEPNRPQQTTAQLRGSTLLLAGRLVATGIGFVTQVLLVRHLTPGDFGAFAYGLGVVVSARILVSLGHNRVVTRFIAIYRERRDSARLLGVLLMEMLLIGGLGAMLFVGVVLGQDLLARTVIDDPQTVAVLAVLILLAPLEALDELFESVLAAYGRAKPIFWRQHVLAPTLRLIVVAALIAMDAQVIFLAVGYVIATFVGVSLYLVVLRRLLTAEDVLGADRPSPRLPVRDIFGFSWPLLSAEFVYISINTVSVVVLGFFGGPAAVGRLRAVWPLAELNLLVRRQFLRLYFATAAAMYERGEIVALRAGYVRTTAWLAVLSYPIVAVTLPLAEPVTVTLFGERYAGAAAYLAVLAAGFYVNAAVGFNAELLLAAAQVRRLVFANLATLAVHISLLLLLGWRMGALGVAIATTAAILVQNGVNQTGVRVVLGTFAPHPLPRVYLLVAGALGILTAVQWLVRPPLVVGLGLVLLTSAALVGATRKVLRLDEAFPALRRVPLAATLVASEGPDAPGRSRDISGGRIRRQPGHHRRTSPRRRWRRNADSPRAR